MKPQTIIFIGKSGSGKGTQADLLEEYLKNNDEKKQDVHHVVTGNFLREFVKNGSYTAGILQNIMSKGLLVPDFLPVMMWGKYFVENVKGCEHIITDGMPRKLNEAIMLDGAFKFFNRANPIVIFLDLSHNSSVKRLLLRKRSDDTQEAIEERLKFYDDDVVPTIDYYRNNPDYTFLTIDGEPDIETISKDILNKLKDLLVK